jgi:hypothetical protein
VLLVIDAVAIKIAFMTLLGNKLLPAVGRTAAFTFYIDETASHDSLPTQRLEAESEAAYG